MRQDGPSVGVAVNRPADRPLLQSPTDRLDAHCYRKFAPTSCSRMPGSKGNRTSSLHNESRGPPDRGPLGYPIRRAQPDASAGAPLQPQRVDADIPTRYRDAAREYAQPAIDRRRRAVRPAPAGSIQILAGRRRLRRRAAEARRPARAAPLAVTPAAANRSGRPLPSAPAVAAPRPGTRPDTTAPRPRPQDNPTRYKSAATKDCLFIRGTIIPRLAAREQANLFGDFCDSPLSFAEIRGCGRRYLSACEDKGWIFAVVPACLWGYEHKTRIIHGSTPTGSASEGGRSRCPRLPSGWYGACTRFPRTMNNPGNLNRRVGSSAKGSGLASGVPRREAVNGRVGQQLLVFPIPVFRASPLCLRILAVWQYFLAAPAA